MQPYSIHPDNNRNRSFDDVIPSGGRAYQIRTGARLFLVGRDARDLLHRITTNDLSKMEVGEVKQSVFTNEKGRMIALASVLLLPDDRVLVVAGGKSPEPLVSWIRKFIIMEEIDIEHVPEPVSHWMCYHPAPGQQTDGLSLTGLISYTSGSDEVTSAQSYIPLSFVEQIGSATFIHLLATQDVARHVFAEKQITEIGREELEHYRISNGVPAHDSEITPNFNPLEAGLTGFVSFSKGCYVGQEVIARLDTYKKVQKRLLCGWMNERPSLLPSRIVFGQSPLGVITSCSSMKEEKGYPVIGYADVGHGLSNLPLVVENEGSSIQLHLM